MSTVLNLLREEMKQNKVFGDEVTRDLIRAAVNEIERLTSPDHQCEFREQLAEAIGRELVLRAECRQLRECLRELRAEVERLTNLIEARGRTMTCLSPWEPDPCPALKLEIGSRELLMTDNAKLRAEVERLKAGARAALGEHEPAKSAASFEVGPDEIDADAVNEQCEREAKDMRQHYDRNE